MMIYSLFYFMFFMGVYSFCINRKHIILVLLSLEFIVLSLYFYLFFYLSIYMYEYFYCMMFMTISVCEGAIGLAILVSMIRVSGNDYLSSLNLLW